MKQLYSKSLLLAVLLLASLVPGLQGQTAVSTSFFNLDLLHGTGYTNAPFPQASLPPVQVPGIRAWDSNTRWSQMQTGCPSTYNFSAIDVFTATTQASGQALLVTLGGVPTCISSAPTDATCAHELGSCDAPTDLNMDGSGLDTTWKAFITALATHVGTTVPYWGCWNEANNTGAWKGTPAQIVRMCYDLRTIVLGINPAAKFLTPEMCDCNNLSFTGVNNHGPSFALATYWAATANTTGTPAGSAQADIVAYHPYPGTNAMEYTVGLITAVTAAQSTAGLSALPQWITEASWGSNHLVPNCPAGDVPPFTQSCLDNMSSELARLEILAASNGIQKYWWYAWASTSNGSLYDGKNGDTQVLYQSGTTYQVMQRLMARTTISPCTNASTIWTCTVTGSNGFLAEWVWDTAQTCTPCTTSTYTVPSAYQNGSQFDITGDPVTVTGATTPIGLKPILLTNNTITITSPTANQSVTGTNFPFQVSGWPAGTTSVEYLCGAHTCFDPGHGAPYADPILASVYTYGKVLTPPFTLPWNSFWVSDGAQVLTATAYDVNGTSLATATQNFVVANTWPVKCTDGTAPASSVSLGTASAGILPVTLTITGSCSTDNKVVTFWIDGVDIGWFYSSSPTLATWAANLDITGFANGPHILGVTWVDQTNYTMYTNAPSGSNNVQTAGEWTQTVTFANGALPSVVHNACHDCYLTTSGTVSLAPALLNTDGTTASSPTYIYDSLNTSVATVNSSGVVTAASSCVPVHSCSAQVYVMAEEVMGTDGVAAGNAITSTAVTFTNRQGGELLYVPSGPCAGTYQGSYTDARVNYLNVVPNFPTSCTSVTFYTGPTSVSNILVWPTNTMPHFGSDGLIHTTYVPGTSLFVHSYEASGLWVAQLPSINLVPTPPYNFRGVTGPLGEIDALGGYNTYELGIIPLTCDDYNGSSQASFTTAINAYVNKYATALAGYTHAKYLYGTGDNIMGSAQGIWGCAQGPQSGPGGATVGSNTPWSQALLAITLSNWASSTTMFGVNMKDEVSNWGSRPLAGPNTPSGTNSWLTSIVADGSGGCVAHGTNMAINVSGNMIITGSATTNMNTAPGSLFNASSFTGSSFNFGCAGVAANTYNIGNDPGLTVQQYAADGYTENSNTSWLNYDAFAKLKVQVNSLGAGHISIMAAPPASGGCQSFANWMGNGSDGPISGISQFGDFAELYSDGSQAIGYLASRNSINWISTGAASVGGYSRGYYGCYSPSLPLINLIQGGESAFTYAGYNVAITSQTNDTITFAAPHGVKNVVPGETRLTVTGSSNTPFNTNFYVLSILSPTQLRVAYQGTTFSSANCTNGTITFSPSGYTETPTVISANGTQITPNFGQNYALYGQIFNLASPDTTNLLKHRGENMTISGCTNTSFNTANWVYLPENVTYVGVSPSTPAYYFRQLPTGSGTGGTAAIMVDSTFRAGISGQQRPVEYDPDNAFATYIEAAIVRSIGASTYVAPSQIGPYYTYAPTSGFVGEQFTGPATFSNPLVFETSSSMFPHWENSCAVPCWHANNFAALHLNRWGKYLLQPAANSPDLNPTFDCGVRTSSYGQVLLCLNITNGPQTQTFTLTPYETSGQQIIQEKIGADGESAITLLSAGTSTQSVTVAGGHAVLFVFPTTFAGELNQPAISVRLADITGATGVSVRWGYDPYLLDVSKANVVNCGSTFPCTLGADKNFGTVYGRIYYYNSGGAMIATSDVQTF